MFIKDLYAISPQQTFDQQFEQGDFVVHTTSSMLAIEPNYLSLIPAGLLRRMGKAVRMGIGAGLPLIERNGKTDGIIIGTANGGLEDCVRFLNQIVEYEEGVLTPTNFVQSTPNALAGQLALMSENTGYNSTHVNGSLAFETTLTDAALFFESTDEDQSLLVGAVEEISEYNYNIDRLARRYKESAVPNDQLFDTNTPGSICGEGATLFVVSSSSEGALAEIADAGQVTSTDPEKVNAAIVRFLERNKMEPEDIDLFLAGASGDNRSDHWYQELWNTHFKDAEYQTYKQYCGDYRSASAFATYLAIRWLNGERLEESGIKNQPKVVLIYNHFDQIRHGFILLKR